MQYKIGQKVKVVSKRGAIGRVTMTFSWRDKILGMDDQEAKLFSAELKSRYGHDYQKAWQMVGVMLSSGRNVWVENRELELIGE